MKRPNIEDYKNIPEGSSIWVSYSGSEYDEDVEKYIDYLESRTKLKNNGDLGDVINPLNVAKKALLDINNWDDDLQEQWDDCGYRAAKALKDIRKLEGNG